MPRAAQCIRCPCRIAVFPSLPSTRHMLGAFLAGGKVGVNRLIEFLQRILWRQSKPTLSDRDVKLPPQHSEVVRLELSPMEKALYKQLYKAGHDSLQKARAAAGAKAPADAEAEAEQGQDEGQGQGHSSNVVPGWSGRKSLSDLVSCCTHAGGGRAFRALAPGAAADLHDGRASWCIEDMLLHVMLAQSSALLKSSQALGSLWQSDGDPCAALQAMERGLRVVAEAEQKTPYRTAVSFAECLRAAAAARRMRQREAQRLGRCADAVGKVQHLVNNALQHVKARVDANGQVLALLCPGRAHGCLSGMWAKSPRVSAVR